MAMTRRGRTRAVIALAAIVLLAMLIDAMLLWRDMSRNALIEAGTPPADATVPALRFALAYAKDETRDLASMPAPAPASAPAVPASAPSLAASAQRSDETLERYRALQAEPSLALAARFNAANVLMRQAIALRAGPMPANALPLIELAKEQYRELLRLDPQHWDARYNLERAQRLVPDPSEEELEPTAAPRERERAPTTMRAQSLGLP